MEKVRLRFVIQFDISSSNGYSKISSEHEIMKLVEKFKWRES